MRFEWDAAKEERNESRPGFGFAARICLGGTIEWPGYRHDYDDRHDYGESRVRAIGEADGLVLHVVFTDRGDRRRIISARMANRKERRLWQSSR